MCYSMISVRFIFSTVLYSIIQFCTVYSIYSTVLYPVVWSDYSTVQYRVLSRL